MNEKWKSRADIPPNPFWSGLETDKANLTSRVFLVLCHLHLLVLFLKDMRSLHNLASQCKPAPQCLGQVWARGLCFLTPTATLPKFLGPLASSQVPPTGVNDGKKRSQSTALPSAASPPRPCSSLRWFSFLCVTLALSFAPLSSFVRLALG